MNHDRIGAGTISALEEMAAAGGTIGRAQWWSVRVATTMPEKLVRLGFAAYTPPQQAADRHARYTMTEAGKAALAEALGAPLP